MGKGNARQLSPGAGHSPLAGNLDFLLAQAMAMLQHGQLGAADGYCRQVLAADPRHLDAMQLLGIVELQNGRHEEAAQWLQQAASLAPRAPGLHCNLGLALQALGRLELALASYDRALALKPKFVEALNNRGNALRELNRLDEAAASYQRALKLQPDFGEALHNLGVTLLALQQPEPALSCLARCLRAMPENMAVLGQYGVALIALKRPQEALACFDRLLTNLPNDAEAHYWRGNALLQMRQYDEAINSYRRAVQIQPDVAEAHYNLGNVLMDQGRQEEALQVFKDALALRPDYVEALYNLGGALQELHRYAEAATHFERLMELAPGHRYTLGKLFHSRQFVGDWACHAEHVEALRQATAEGTPREMPFPFMAVSPDPVLQQRCAQAFSASKYPSTPVPLWASPRHEHDRIRIAYVSADFRAHALSYLMVGLFEAHDRARFEIIGLSLKASDGSAMGARVAAAFDQFVDVSSLSDVEVATLMRELEVDIAVDLTGYTQNNRTAIFALRPAPIQVNYLGYPGTMGADFIDYIIADEFVIPEGAARFYTEQIAYLPECYQGNDDQRAIAAHTPSRSEAGLPESGFVFCVFNNTYKLTPIFFDLWMRLLTRVPGSVLWFAVDDPGAQRNLWTEAEKRGVAAQRLVFSSRLNYADHLARLRLADLFLDTLPFNAGTTASDALWAGVPVLTCAGEAFAARMAGSLLQAVGLPELITHDLEAYEALAFQLATRSGQLAEIRTRLEKNRQSMPLFDTNRFCRHLESAYEQMWARHQRGAPPITFKLAATNEPLLR